MDAHRHGIVTGRCQHLDVDAIREPGRVERHGRRDVEVGEFLDGQIWVDAREVRVAHVDREAGETPPAYRCLAGAHRVGLAHLHGDVGGGGVDVMQPDRPGPRQRTDHELVPILESAGT